MRFAYEDSNHRRIHVRRSLMCALSLALVLFLSRVFLLPFIEKYMTNPSPLVTNAFSPSSTQEMQQQSHRRLQSSDPRDGKIKILYIVTSSSATYKIGNKHTGGTKVGDRVNDLMFPVLLDCIDSLMQEPTPYHIDLFLISSYNVTATQYRTLRDALPPTTGLQLWEDATPFNYVCYPRTGKCWGPRGKRNLVEPDKKVIQYAGAQLARQHRYVIKDKFEYYDYFMAFEDDMLIKRNHVDHHRRVMAELQKLHAVAPVRPDKNIQRGHWWGSLTKAHLSRMRPGLMRVEVETWNITKTQSQVVPIPVDREFIDANNPSLVYNSAEVDPVPCCATKRVQHHPDASQSKEAPVLPDPSLLLMWETAVNALGVRQMPQLSPGNSSSSSLNWVMLLPGAFIDHLSAVPQFWAGHAATKPVDGQGSRHPKVIAQSAGWIASRRELDQYNTQFCPGGFLPPFEGPGMGFDGLENNVEFYSGGLQLWLGCRIQRIVMLDNPKVFSQHLIYHTANNKQFRIDDERKVRLNDMLGQLNTVRKLAEARKNQDIQSHQRSKP